MHDSSAPTEILQMHDGKVGDDFRFRQAWQGLKYQRRWQKQRCLWGNVGGRRAERESFAEQRPRRAPCWLPPARWLTDVSICFDGFGTRSSPGSQRDAMTPLELSALSLIGSVSRRTPIPIGTPVKIHIHIIGVYRFNSLGGQPSGGGVLGKRWQASLATFQTHFKKKKRTVCKLQPGKMFTASEKGYF